MSTTTQSGGIRPTSHLSELVLRTWSVQPNSPSETGENPKLSFPATLDRKRMKWTSKEPWQAHKMNKLLKKKYEWEKMLGFTSH